MPAYYRATLEVFAAESTSEIVGRLTIANSASRFPLPPEQIDAWRIQVEPLKQASLVLASLINEARNWELLIEYPIPRLGKRLDAVLLAQNIIIAIEFKTGQTAGSGIRQVEDYAMLLSNFHQPSHGSAIVPLLVGVNTRSTTRPPRFALEPILPTETSSIRDLSEVLKRICLQNIDLNATPINSSKWDQGLFKPVPSIIEAAVTLYSEMNVFEIGHACAAEESLDTTTNAICSLVLRAKSNREKLICFVTGVPGAGKTLVGLNTIHRPEIKNDGSFLSGNGPLIKVIREALVRDVLERKKTTRVQAELEVQAFVHNVHRFADEYFDNKDAHPTQNVIVFDEAQRAWNAKKNFKAYKRDISEPDMILEIMNRHKDWSVIVALVGGGQEIHDGEAGLAEWGKALANYPEWKVVASPEVLAGGSSVAGFRLFDKPDRFPSRVIALDALHLPISIRSFRSQRISDWVNAVLQGDSALASHVSKSTDGSVCFLTRDLDVAKAWLRERSRGFTKCGLVASASASRLRFDGLEPSYEFHSRFDWDHWFLDEQTQTSDIRACWNLEVFATQFEIQGLELDWIGLCWGEDLIWTGTEWKSFRFANTGWKGSVKPEKHQFKLNAYRVLLTRARQGMVVYVPKPPASDNTRLHEELDSTADFLLGCGATALEAGTILEKGVALP